MIDNWITALANLQSNRIPSVLVTILAEMGSTPRDRGTKMVVTRDRQYCTIGGGHLEYQCCAIAREMLSAQTVQCRTERFSLGARLGQCCGGMTSVLFEPVNVGTRPHIALFGAGHVAQALVRVLADLPCGISWVDQRAELFPLELDENINVIAEEPMDTLADMPANSYFVVMTHDHQLDFQLIESILLRNDYLYCGLIGSETKRQRFLYRLGQRGMSRASLSHLRCPIGLAAVKGKLPGEIAIAIAAEIISLYNGNDA